MKIYYTVSVRSVGLSRETVRQHIDILKSFGNVLTEHLGSDNTNVIDMGKTDSEIYFEDKKLLDESDFVVADISYPSLGVGFMISQALSECKPILCLKNHKDKISAMINGSGVLILEYSDLKSYRKCIQESIKFNYELLRENILKPLKLFFVGLPGSGKSTICKRLEEELNIIHISTGDLVRNIMKEDNGMSEIIKSYVEKGLLIPATIMKNIVLNRLRQHDCKIFGYSLDGYPPSTEDLQNLREEKISPDYVFYFECSDNLSISRQCSRSERITDTLEVATKRVQTFHSKIPTKKIMQEHWYEHIPVISVNACMEKDEVYNYIKSIILNSIKIPEYSYMPIENLEMKSTQFHYHIDAQNSNILRKITNRIYANDEKTIGNIKIYPISHLCLGPQINKMPTYNSMMNFHEINELIDEQAESFVTGRMGDNFDPNLMYNILHSAKTSDQKCMIECEQYVGEWQYVLNGEIIGTTYSENPIDINNYEKLFDFKENINKNIPKFELHFGIDIDKEKVEDTKKYTGLTDNQIYYNQNTKVSIKLPIKLNKLMEKCTENGFENGGWFIFKNEKKWAYRSNQFSELSLENCKKLLFEQAVKLHNILEQEGIAHKCQITMSLEYVHGIWQFN